MIPYWCQCTCYLLILSFNYGLFHDFSIRAMCGLDSEKNCVHGSDSLLSAQREISFFFEEETGNIYSLSIYNAYFYLFVHDLLSFSIIAIFFTVTFIVFTPSFFLYEKTYSYSSISQSYKWSRVSILIDVEINDVPLESGVVNSV